MDTAQKLLLFNSLKEKYDSCNAVLTFETTGAAKVALSDSVQGLLRAYQRFASKHDLTAEEIEVSDASDKTLQISGLNAYGLFRNEHGTHRFINMYEGRKLTRFISIQVKPEVEIPETILNPLDLRYEFLKSCGNGGQNAQKNSNVVRATHMPTGLSAIARSRSRAQNMESVRAVLSTRLALLSDSRNKQPIMERVIPTTNARHLRTYDSTANYIRDENTGVRTNYNVFFEGNIEPFIYASHGIRFSGKF